MTASDRPTVVLHAGALGDLVLTIHLATQLPQTGPAGLTLISRTDPGDLSSCEPSIIRHSLETLEPHWLYMPDAGPTPDRLRRLIEGKNVLSSLGNAQCTVHRNLLAAGASRVFSFDPRPAPNLIGHIVDQWRRDLRSQGLEFAATGSALRPAAEMRKIGRQILKKNTGTTSAILLHPGSGGRSKCWPLAAFLELAQILRSRGFNVSFVIGPAEIDRLPADELSTLRREFSLIENPPPSNLANILAAADGFVGNDAGPTHLAALLGTPTIAVFGPTSADNWRPLGPTVSIIRGDPLVDPVRWNLAPEQIMAQIQHAVRDSGGGGDHGPPIG